MFNHVRHVLLTVAPMSQATEADLFNHVKHVLLTVQNMRLTHIQCFWLFIFYVKPR